MAASSSLFSIGKTVLEKLGPLVQQEAALMWNLQGELEKMNGTLTAIQALLLDAEEQQAHSRQVKDWLQKLELLFLDAEDLLDDVATEALREEAAARDRDDSSRCWTVVRFLFSIPSRVIYGLKMAHKVKSLGEQLDDIHDDNTKLHLNPRFEERGKMVKHTLTISSIPDIVVGREDDLNHIKQLLLLADNGPRISVVSIFGIGGMGKTTLAQLIYNDRQVKEHFKLRIWACVSGLFELRVITTKILESATKEKISDLEPEALTNLLGGFIGGKKFFLVLDDVWDFNPEEWDMLRSVLKSGASGSKILVTTRFENFAKMMSRGSPDPPYALSGLSSPQSWSLFRQVMSGGGNHQLAVEEPLNISNVEQIKEQIMKKSVGVPLAVKTVANLLSFKDPQTEWLSFLQSNELLSAKHENSMLHNLKLSYNYLPSHLKRCFLLCSLYPKDIPISVRELIFHWFALGFIESSPEDTKQSLYDLGLQYFMDLTWRSFFQEIKRDRSNSIKSCRMHGLIHDLAVSVSGSNYSEINEPTATISKTTYHMSLSHDLWCPTELVGHLEKAKQLRTFFSVYKKWYQSGTSWDESTFRSFISKFPSLRILAFWDSGMEVLSDDIQELKHLRYLDISLNNKITRLPPSITMLQNLQALWLSECSSLQELPRDINKLVNLWILACRGCFALTHMPVGLGELTRLEVLTYFVVGKEDSFTSKQTVGGLDELHRLDKLRARLEIANLGALQSRARVLSPSPLLAFELGAAANLMGKPHLETLILGWGLDNGEWEEIGREEVLTGSEEDAEWDESLLEGLQPSSCLKSLEVIQYKGGKCPSWISCLTNLVTLSLYWCKVRHGLHQLQELPVLRRLTIVRLLELEFMDEDEEEEEEEEEDGDRCWVLAKEGTKHKKTSKPFFPSLEKLGLHNCPKLKGWRRRKLPQFPKLSKLSLMLCPLLTMMPLFPTLDKGLQLVGTSLEPLLCTMNVPSSSVGNTSCSSFSSEVDLMQYPLSKLKKLQIYGVDDPPRDWLRGMQHLTSLQELRIGIFSGLEETLNWRYISHVPEITLDRIYINRDGQFLWDEFGWDNFHLILQIVRELMAKNNLEGENSRG
ncbi:unnamed protein product [Linum trigynum]|uniref:Disease resistance protein RGA3 n=1 Tax=Linum trigynum TaxID=586398 RepID=A0AAV2CP76_9ROSI